MKPDKCLTIEDLMVPEVITVAPHLTVEHARFTMRTKKVHALPVVNDDGEPVGIISSDDLLEDLEHGTPIQKVMTKHVHTMPRYAGLHEAAHVMREHRIHHLVVTDESKVVGILSTFDLLRFVEEHRCSA